MYFTNGNYIMGGNFKIKKAAPMDDRGTVAKKIDLQNPNLFDGFTYNGMIVSVVDDTINNGLYRLEDKSTLTWKKEGSDVNFTASLRDKLMKVSDNNRGAVSNETALASIANPMEGDFALVRSTLTFWAYESGAWVDTHSSTTAGSDGLSAYELDVLTNGYSGTLEQWLIDLKGEPGTNVDLSNYYTKSETYNKSETDLLVDTKQDNLVSGTSIKTINGQSVLGSGDIIITGGGVDDTDVVKAPLGVLPVLDGSNLTGIDGLPDQTGFAGKYLKTDGTIATWESASTGTGITNNEFIATAGQTVFTVTYTVGNLDVYQNGLLLSYTDYVATDGTSIILAVGATTGDLVSVKVYDTFSVYDAYTKAEVDANIDESITTSIAAIDLSSKQDTLVSGTSIKTINGQSVLGNGNIVITGGASLTNYYDKTETETLLSNKVDKVTGKGLSTNDFTDTFKQALELKKVQDISTDSVNKKLVVNYTDDTVANLNINDIVTDVKVEGATLDATTNVLTLTSTDGGADVTVDLSDFVNSGEFTSALSGKADKIHSHSTSDIAGLDTTLSNLTTNLSNKQDTLVSGTSIKTINSSSILGSGNLDLLTATNPSITGSITEYVYNLTGAEINPTNGTIQYKTVSANTTFTETLISGQSVLLRLINANSYTITFPTITWIGKSAPTLTANCVIVLWKEQSTLYGAYVGSLV